MGELYADITCLLQYNDNDNNMTVVKEELVAVDHYGWRQFGTN